MKSIEHDIDFEYADDVIDMVAKVLLLRGGGVATISFDDLETASATKCSIEKTDSGLVFRTERTAVYDTRQ